MARWLGPPVGKPPASIRTPVGVPLVSHLSGFSWFSSGEGASSAYGPQWDDVPVTCILSRCVCIGCSFWLVRECVGV